MPPLVSSVQVIQAALKGLQCCLSGGKWKFGGGEELGSVLASLKVPNFNTFPDFSIAVSFILFVTFPAQTLQDRSCCSNNLESCTCFLQRLMFQGTPGVSVEWPAVLYPAPLPQYEGLSAPKPAEPPKPSELPKDAAMPGKTSGVRQALICVGIRLSKDCFKISY